MTHNASGAKKKKNRNVISVGASDAEHYKLALMNPFSERALGARVPDQFFAPTATVALREIISLSNDTSGNIECILMPNVYCPAASFRGSIANGTTLQTPDGVGFTKGAILNASSTLAAKIMNYRIVGWGIRIRNTTAVTGAQGVLTVALVPPHLRMRVPQNATIGGQNAGGTGAGNFRAEDWLLSMGIPSTGTGSNARVDLTALLDLPFHARYQGTQLAEQTFEVHPKLTSPLGLEFRNSNDGYWGSDMQATTSAVYVQPGDASYLMLDGWTSVVVGYSGGSTTAGAQTFDLELIYHLEGTPNVTSAQVFVADAPISHHNPVVAMTAQAALNAMPTFTRVAGAAMAAYRSFGGH